jgi:hypothetical protein
MGVMREDELFSQARSGTFAGQFNFADDNLHPNRTGYAWANAVLGQVRSYQESMGRVPDDRRQRTWAWYLQDTWKVTPKITMDIGLRMYKWGQAVAQGGESSVFSQERFDPRWVATRPCFPAGAGWHDATARNPLTGQVLPATFIGLIAGTGHLHAGHHSRIRARLTHVTQRDGNYLENGDEGLSSRCRFARPTIRMAWRQDGYPSCGRVRLTALRTRPAGRWKRGVLEPTIFYTDLDSPDRRRGPFTCAEHRRPDPNGRETAEQHPLHRRDPA